ncbi:MAG: hypothetical protein AB7G93_20840, partial [Bdellovibrionales bacterium]
WLFHATNRDTFFEPAKRNKTTGTARFLAFYAIRLPTFFHEDPKIFNLGISFVFTILLIGSIQNCSHPRPAADTSGPAAAAAPATTGSSVLIAPAVSVSAVSASGNQGFEDATRLITSAGGNVFLLSANWQDLEATPGRIQLQSGLSGPLTVLSKFTKLEGIVYVLKMIDSNVRVMPSDLQGLPFDDPTVLARFEALIEAIAADPNSARLTHILLGNEVDGYLGQHSAEVPAFLTLLNLGIKRIHQKMPNVKVGTIITANGAKQDPSLFASLNKNTDFIDYTYYPDTGDIKGNSTLKMKPMSEIVNDLEFLAQNAGKKPFAFTEIGCSSAGSYGSSEDVQAQFVSEVFRVLKPYRTQGQVAFLIYQLLYDYAPDLCGPYAAQQGVSADAICDLMNNAGLRRYSDGQPKKAWDVFLKELTNW